jgi:MOSC domain-containing protein YiiM
MMLGKFDTGGYDTGKNYIGLNDTNENGTVRYHTGGDASDNKVVISVSRSATHSFRKKNEHSIHLLTGLGVEGDAHQGTTVKHRSRVAKDPTQPNLRQVHLIHAELHDELREAGFHVSAGQMGENITTRGLDLLGMPTGTKLYIGSEAVVEITGLRNPCQQLDHFQSGLMKAVLDRDEHGNLIRKAGVMGIVLAGGEVRPGDAIRVQLPPEPHRPLERV